MVKGLKQGLWESLYSLLWLFDQLMVIAGPMSGEGAFLNNYSPHHGAIETSSQGRIPDDGSSFGKGALHGAILPIKYDGPWPPWCLLWKWWLLIERWWLELRYTAVFAGHGGWKYGGKNLKLEITPWAGNLEGKLTPSPWAYGVLSGRLPTQHLGLVNLLASPELEPRVPPLGYWIWNVDAGLSKGSSIDHPNLGNYGDDQNVGCNVGLPASGSGGSGRVRGCSLVLTHLGPPLCGHTKDGGKHGHTRGCIVDLPESGSRGSDRSRGCSEDLSRSGNLGFYIFSCWFKSPLHGQAAPPWVEHPKVADSNERKARPGIVYAEKGHDLEVEKDLKGKNIIATEQDAVGVRTVANKIKPIEGETEKMKTN
ncbi:hypothetical protein V6N12_010104 [Hibiscus sabdariffa]|uniref:Uncharacterized protein n=1 Tax=Hibiscus sabdariffa TaxID=183260 RepID=A0ABR2ECP8_9ROSI